MTNIRKRGQSQQACLSVLNKAVNSVWDVMSNKALQKMKPKMSNKQAINVLTHCTYSAYPQSKLKYQQQISPNQSNSTVQENNRPSSIKSFYHSKASLISFDKNQDIITPTNHKSMQKQCIYQVKERNSQKNFTKEKQNQCFYLQTQRQKQATNEKEKQETARKNKFQKESFNIENLQRQRQKSQQVNRKSSLIKKKYKQIKTVGYDYDGNLLNVSCKQNQFQVSTVNFNVLNSFKINKKITLQKNKNSVIINHNTNLIHKNKPSQQFIYFNKAPQLSQINTQQSKRMTLKSFKQILVNNNYRRFTKKQSNVDAQNRQKNFFFQTNNKNLSQSQSNFFENKQKSQQNDIHLSKKSLLQLKRSTSKRNKTQTTFVTKRTYSVDWYPKIKKCNRIQIRNPLAFDKMLTSNEN